MKIVPHFSALRQRPRKDLKPLPQSAFNKSLKPNALARHWWSKYHEVALGLAPVRSNPNS